MGNHLPWSRKQTWIKCFSIVLGRSGKRVAVRWYSSLNLFKPQVRNGGAVYGRTRGLHHLAVRLRVRESKTEYFHFTP